MIYLKASPYKSSPFYNVGNWEWQTVPKRGQRLLLRFKGAAPLGQSFGFHGNGGTGLQVQVPSKGEILQDYEVEFDFVDITLPPFNRPSNSQLSLYNMPNNNSTMIIFSFTISDANNQPTPDPPTNQEGVLDLTNAKSLYYGTQEAIKLYLGSQLLWEKSGDNSDDNSFELDLLGNNVVLPTLWDVQDQINSRTQNYQGIDRIVIHLKKGNQFILSDISKDGSADIRAGNVDPSPSGTRFISNRDIDKVIVYLNA